MLYISTKGQFSCSYKKIWTASLKDLQISRWQKRRKNVRTGDTT